VFINDNASAPALSAAFAISVICVTFGESLTIKGVFVAFRHAETSFSVSLESIPKAIPPSFIFGHDIFSS